MDTQTFRAPSMLEALQTIQKELGPDAIVVSMRELESSSGWPLKRKPYCEIVAARPHKPAVMPVPVQALDQPAPVHTPAKTLPAPDPAIQALAQLAAAKTAAPVRKDPAPPQKNVKPLRPFKPEVLSTRSSTMTWIANDDILSETKPASPPPPTPTAEPKKTIEPVELDEPDETNPLDRISAHLLNQGLNGSLVKRLSRICTETLTQTRLADAGYLASFLKKQLSVNLHKSVLKLEEGRHVVCVIGPSGAGKTNVCAKLAANFALNEGKRVAWIEANTVRTGAISEARMITESLGVELHLAYTSEDLVDALSKTQDADLVLVDTASCNPRLESNLVDLANMITKIPRRTTFLVTPATTKESDLKYSLAAFSPFQLDGFVVTKMDEATTTGSIYNLTWQSKIPVVYVSSGAMVMDELERGDAQWLVNTMFNEV